MMHRWDGQAYQLIGEFSEMQLRVEFQESKDTGRQDVIVRYNVGPHQLPIPWVDVYTLSGG